MSDPTRPSVKLSESSKPKPGDKACSPYFWAVDVGGTNIKLGLLDDDGRTLAYDTISTFPEHYTPPQYPEGAADNEVAQAAIIRAAETCRKLAREAGVTHDQILRAGLGTPGPMSLSRGMLLNPSNLPGWHNFHVVEALQRALDKPVSFINDANAAALGEFWIGAGRQYDSLAMFTLGTGVGGGFIVEGKLVNGVNSFGSEIGHIVVDSRPDARLCVWGGGLGHLEAYASASAVAARAQEGIRNGARSSLSEVARKQGGITTKDVHQAALHEDAFALELIDEAAFYLGIGVTCAVHAIDPGLVLLGGAMNFGGSACPVGRRFLRGIAAEFEKRTFPNVYAGTKIEFATLGGDAGYIGAAAAARQDA